MAWGQHKPGFIFRGIQSESKSPGLKTTNQQLAGKNQKDTENIGGPVGWQQNLKFGSNSKRQRQNDHICTNALLGNDGWLWQSL